MARYVRLFSALALAAVLAALFGGHAGAAEPNRLPLKAQAIALDPPPSGSAAKTAQAREPVASSAKKKKKKKKKKRKRKRRPAPTAPTRPAPPTHATISGHTNWSSANVNLQHVAGGSWVNTSGGQTLSDASGNYSHTVLAGYTYRYYVWFRFYMPFNFGGVIIQCHQLWADASASVTAVGGQNYPNLDTFPQPTGPIGC